MQEHFEVFASLISGIHGNIKKLKAAYTEELGLKEVHIFWIYLLKTHPEGMTASEIAEASRQSRSLVSREIQELLKKNILYTDENTGKRRYGWKLFLSPEGEKMAARISEVADTVQSVVSRDIDVNELEIFYKTLRSLSNNFDKLDVEKLKEHNK